VFGAALVILLQSAREGLWPNVLRIFPGPGATRQGLRYSNCKTLPRVNREPFQGPLLAVSHLKKNFGGLTAIGDVSFEVWPGEIVGLIGPNGAGKSTAFDLISGAQPVSGGELRFAGTRIDGLAPHTIARLGLARTFQHVKLAPAMTALENVALGAHLRATGGALAGAFHMDRNEEASLLCEAERQLERVGLADVANRPGSALSLGQQRIVEVARALCLDPLLLLLDEPAAGLRHLEKKNLAALLGKLRGEGMSILLVEHDIDFVMNLAGRVVVMNFGFKLAEGEPEAIRNHAQVVEAYLGSFA
jgi:branched-chain amino acid transport system permease protein